MTDVSIDKDELVLLSMVWCDALKIDIGEAGVLVKPDEVREFLHKAFVTERGKWHGPRRAICAEFDIPEMHENPYKALIQQRGPAFMSIRRVGPTGCFEFPFVVPSVPIPDPAYATSSRKCMPTGPQL